MSPHDSVDTVQKFLNKVISVEKHLSDQMQRLADAALDNSAKSLLSSVAQNSRRHAKILNNILETLGDELETEFTHDIINTEFPDLQELLNYDIPIEVIYYAAKEHIAFEEGFRQAYEELGFKVSQPEALKMFKQLSEDETRHHSMLSNIVFTLNNMYKDSLDLK